MRRTSPLWLLLAVVVGVCAAEAARAEEPCRRVPEGVLCTEAAFSRLRDVVVDAEAARDHCRVDLDLRTAELAASKARVEALEAVQLPAGPSRLVWMGVGAGSVAIVFLGAFLLAR